jgi:hypothetical protein
MSTASKLKTAKARASLAWRIYAYRSPWKGVRYGESTDFGRALDGCFENGDGDAVILWMVYGAAMDPKLLALWFTHHARGTNKDWPMMRAMEAIRAKDQDAFGEVWTEFWADAAKQTDQRELPPMPTWSEPVDEALLFA